MRQGRGLVAKTKQFQIANFVWWYSAWNYHIRKSVRRRRKPIRKSFSMVYPHPLTTCVWESHPPPLMRSPKRWWLEGQIAPRETCVPRWRTMGADRVQSGGIVVDGEGVRVSGASFCLPNTLLAWPRAAVLFFLMGWRSSKVPDNVYIRFEWALLILGSVRMWYVAGEPFFFHIISLRLVILQLL